MSDSAYLIGNGWRPSPTTFSADGAWEHPHIKVPHDWSVMQEVYEPGRCRMPLVAALFLQLAIERSRDDDIAQKASWISHAVFEAARVMSRSGLLGR